MRITQLSPREALASLHSSAGGLGSAEARKRQDEYGPNRIEHIRGAPLWRQFAGEFVHFFALILWLAAALAFFAESREPGEGMATLGWAILGVIAINGSFSFWQAYRAERAIAALGRLLPQQVTVLRDGRANRLHAEQLVPGDVVLVQEGDSVPADCRLLEADGLRLSLATLTGESLPQSRTAEASGSSDPLGATNLLLAGTAVVAGHGRALVFATGMRTEFGKIARLTQTGGEGRSPLQEEIVRLSRLLASIALGIGVLFFLIGQALGLPFWSNLIFAIGIIVANVPEGLLPTVTLALAMATQRMARNNALIRHLPAVETLGAATVICTDKTGTLTLNRMSVRQLYVGDGLLELPLDAAQRQRCRPLLAVARHCHDLREVSEAGRQQVLGDPMEVALVEMARDAGEDAGHASRVHELPFDAARKRMSTVHDLAEGRRLFCKGAPEVVLELCNRMLEAGSVRELDPARRARLRAAQEGMAGRGLRVLALAWRELAGEPLGAELESGLILAGLVGIEDPPRAEVPQAIRRCREAGIQVIMLTGDHPVTATAIAREIGLVDAAPPRVLTGGELAHLSDSQLQFALDAPQILFARVSADQKLRVVEALQRKGAVVAATGDGVNDAPALRRADIGIAMGVSGTDVAREAADMVLLDDNFASIVRAVEEGRAVYANLRKFLTYILSSNIPELVPYLAFVLLRIPLPLTIIQILAVDLGTDMLPALALGAERADPQVMQRPPRPRSERLLSWPLLARAYLFLGPLEALAGMSLFFLVLDWGGWQYGSPLARLDPLYLQATGACLAAIVVMQVANVLVCRSPTESIRNTGMGGNPLGGNPLLLAGIAFELALIAAIVYTPWGQALFGTAALPAAAWLAMLPFAGLLLLLEELRKAWVRRRQGPPRQ
ncbi:cation-translocating P-type ATPase [Pseudomonas oryzae]|uniref:Sodium/potassium-transporting ATPase subunit alpha n=1 Tax=Pseudomonas oryzae TaxID=1392877 RepID=A0A1H1W1D1_9PSED|nr:cation-transporting P-type ATPase [Pseudomonas oryzae]SDS90904.1 sodium/potassium-transporting ATPase subunit alpha [Pseudomonas oryzae]